MTQRITNINFAQADVDDQILRSAGYSDIEKVAYLTKRELQSYIRKIADSDSDIVRRSIIPNFMDYGKLIDFQDNWEKTQLHNISARFEFATLNIFFTISDYDNYDNFSVYSDGELVKKYKAANVYWGLCGRDLNGGIVWPFATSLTALQNNMHELPLPDRCDHIHLVPKTSLVALPAWDTVNDSILDLSAFESCLKKSIEKNGQKAFHGYVDALYRQINIP